MSKKSDRATEKLQFDINEVKDFIIANEDCKIYLGCDSVKTKKKKYRYATVICIHYKGCRGAKIFGEITYNNVKDSNVGRPINRMLAEVQLIIDMYTRLEDTLLERIDDVSIHLDINPNKTEGSSIAYGAAKGMIEGMIGLDAICKPFSFAASFAADHYVHKYS